MKLSDIKGARTLDVIAEIAAPVARIAIDDNAMALFQRDELPKDKDPKEFVLEKVERSLPALMKEHRDDVVTILAAIKGVPRDEYLESMNLASVLVDLTELVTDEEFTAFLSSDGQTAD